MTDLLMRAHGLLGEAKTETDHGGRNFLLSSAVELLIEHLRTLTPPAEAKDDCALCDAAPGYCAKHRPKKEEPAGPSDEADEPYTLGRALFGSIPWNACAEPAGSWSDADEDERRAWEEVARNVFNQGRASLAEGLSAKDQRIAELEAELATLRSDDARLAFASAQSAVAELAEKDRTIGELRARVAAYNELILAVETITTGESRHESALRYIRQAETRVTGVGTIPPEHRPEGKA